MQFDPEIPAHAEILATHARNQERIVALANQGIQVNIDRASALLEFIADRLDGGPDRLDFERRWADSISDVLDQGEAQVHQAKILQGVGGVDLSQLNRAQRRQAARAGNGQH